MPVSSVNFTQHCFIAAGNDPGKIPFKRIITYRRMADSEYQTGIMIAFDNLDLCLDRKIIPYTITNDRLFARAIVVGNPPTGVNARDGITMIYPFKDSPFPSGSIDLLGRDW